MGEPHQVHVATSGARFGRHLELTKMDASLLDLFCIDDGPVGHQPCPAKNEHEVFLGGTCGESRWRPEQAIPLLEAAGCSFYNPQLAPGTWTPECIPIERDAKEYAVCILFVVTADTRGVASMVEIAELLSTGRRMVVVITSYQQTEEYESRAMIDDVNRGRKYLKDLAARWKCPMFDNVEDATAQVIEMVKQSQQPQEDADRPQAVAEGSAAAETPQALRKLLAEAVAADADAKQQLEVLKNQLEQAIAADAAATQALEALPECEVPAVTTEGSTAVGENTLAEVPGNLWHVDDTDTGEDLYSTDTGI